MLEAAGAMGRWPGGGMSREVTSCDHKVNHVTMTFMPTSCQLSLLSDGVALLLMLNTSQ